MSSFLTFVITSFMLLLGLWSGVAHGAYLVDWETKSNLDIYYNVGNVGIGTTDPQEKLDIDGRIALQPSSTPGTTANKLYNIGGNLYWNGSLIGSGGGGTGITALGGQTGSTQEFANDTNVTLTSAGDTHTLGWLGQLAVERGGTGKDSWTPLSIPFASTASSLSEISIGTAGEFLKVNATEDGYEWGSVTSGSQNFTELLDTPSSYSGQAEKIVKVKSDETGLEFVTGGADGTDGKTVLNGVSDPTSGVGVDGDFYINTSTNTIFGPKTGGAWGSGTSLVGPQGIQGIQGEIGPQGPQGLPGVDGTDGADGTNGLDGKTVLNGTVDPTTQGVDGDFYINTSTNTIFGPKTGGAWGSGTSLVGPQGLPGTNGTNGTDGLGWTGGSYNASTGIVTFTSENGLGFSTSDLRGIDGINGADGADGEKWFSGTTVPNSSTPSLAKSGDLYLKTDDGNVYEKQIDNSWDLVANIMGSQGPAGDPASDTRVDDGLSCSNGQVLKWNGSNWICDSDETGDALPTGNDGDFLVFDLFSGGEVGSTDKVHMYMNSVSNRGINIENNDFIWNQYQDVSRPYDTSYGTGNWYIRNITRFGNKDDWGFSPAGSYGTSLYAETETERNNDPNRTTLQKVVLAEDVVEVVKETSYDDTLGTSETNKYVSISLLEGTGDRYIGADADGKLKEMPTPSRVDDGLSCTDGQILKWNHSLSQWECSEDAGSSGGDGVGYDRIQNNGSDLTKRATFNVSNGLIASDDTGNNRTNVSLMPCNDQEFLQWDNVNGWECVSGGTDGADGTDGKTVLNGTVDPTTQGVDGDFYINTSTNTIFGPKTGGAWGSGTSLVGPQGLPGTNGTNGTDGLGWTGGSYNASTGIVTFTSENGLGFSTSDLRGIDGINGADGEKWFSGTTVPNSSTPSLAKSGDLYLKTDDGNVYEKQIDNSWDLVANIRGPQGLPGSDGTDGTNGTDGLGWTGGSYNASTGIVTFTSENGLGFSTSDLRGIDGINGADGADGEKWFSGTTVPNSSTPSLAKSGDLYLKTDDGNVYEKQIDNSWDLVANIRGPQGPAGDPASDDQKIDTFGLTSNTLSLSLENDGEAPKTVDIEWNNIGNASGVYMDYRPNNIECNANEVLKWNATDNRWVCGLDASGSGGDDWGAQKAVTDHPLTGDGTSGNPLDLADCADGEILKWDNTSSDWQCGNDETDNWGTQVIISDSTLDGDGTSGSPLRVRKPVSDKKTTNYTITVNDYLILCDASSNNVTITLPLASNVPERQFVVKRTDNNLSNSCTIARNGTDIIDNNLTSRSILGQNASLSFISDGDQWWIE